MTLPTSAQVFVGGAVGGALRIGIDEVFATGAHGIPWDILAINIVGSFALGVVAARSEATGNPRYLPLIGPGLLGGFTTFSAIATLHWATGTNAWVAAAVLASSMLAAVGAAAWGWSLAGRRELRS